MATALATLEPGLVEPSSSYTAAEPEAAPESALPPPLGRSVAVPEGQRRRVPLPPKPAPSSVLASVLAAASPAQPLLSVVVCTYNGARTLAEALRALAKQTYTHYEVLVIDDGSTDDIAGIASAFHQVLYHRVDHAGLSAARNSGMNLAKGEIIVYTDDDCAPDEDWLLRISEAFDDERWVAAGGPNLSPTPHRDRALRGRCTRRTLSGPAQ